MAVPALAPIAIVPRCSVVPVELSASIPIAMLKSKFKSSVPNEPPCNAFLPIAMLPKTLAF